MTTQPDGSGQAADAPCCEPVSYMHWESSAIPELFFVGSTLHDFAYAEHVHDALEIVWVRSGAAEIRCRGVGYRMQPGDAIILAPGEVHAGGALEGSSFSFATLHVPRHLLSRLVDLPNEDETGAVPLPPVQLMTGPVAERFYRFACALPETISAGDQITCLRDAMRIMPPRRRVPEHGEHPAVQRVRAILNREFAGSIDVATLAEEVGLHARYLISLFRAQVGIPPHQYQIAQRVDCGRRLLGREMPLGTVACTAGFADQSHFNRLFKRTYRITPGAFRDGITPYGSEAPAFSEPSRPSSGR